MSYIGFVKPNYPNEKRVALLPKHIRAYRDRIFYDQIYIEKGFGSSLEIDDAAYVDAGCQILSRPEIFRLPTVYSLKLIQPVDYELLSSHQRIIGWMHPNGSGRSFCRNIAADKNISIFDIDSVYPRIYHPDGRYDEVLGLPRHFFWQNSYIAGMASTKLGLDFSKFDPIQRPRIAVLGSGSVAQGAFCYLASLGCQPRMFYRKTLDLFVDQIDEFDLIVNGIEVDSDGMHIIDEAALRKTRLDVLIIDAAADAGRAIQGTEYLSLEQPVGRVQGRAYTLVNNAPTLMHPQASEVISEVTASLLLNRDFFLRSSPENQSGD